jgi:hypothetical protein
MPLSWKSNPSQQFVMVIAEGEVTRAEVEVYLSEIERLNAVGWRKLVDLRNARGGLSEEDVLSIGLRLRQADASGHVGALAVVLPQSDPERVMRLLGFLAAAKRPMRIFKTLQPAQRWIKSIAPKRKRAQP